MKPNTLIMLFLTGMAIVCLFSSCGAMVYGTSTNISINTYKGTDTVNIVALGPKRVVEYKNLPLPNKIKVKHNNLPLRVSMYSNDNLYASFDIDGDDEFMKIGLPMMTIGACVGLITAPFAPVVGCVGIGGMFMGLTFLGAKSVPITKYTMTSSISVDESNKHLVQEEGRREQYISDVYSLLGGNQLEKAKALIDWLISKGEIGELVYLKGLYYSKSDKLKKAENCYERALTMIDVEDSPALYYNTSESLKATRESRKQNKIERVEMWSDIISAVALTGVVAYQGYAQAQNFDNLQKMGLSPSGEIVDPSKVTAEQLTDPNFAMMQVELQYRHEYLQETDGGKTMSYEEWYRRKGEAIMKLKEQGYDVLAEQRELSRQQAKDWRESMEEDRKQRLADNKAYLEAVILNQSNSNSFSSSSGNYSNTSSSSNSTHNNISSIDTHSLNDISKKDEEKLDSKQQYHKGEVSSSDYKYEKRVTLYIRDGKDNKAVEIGDLCRKGAWYYVKIDKMYYKVFGTGDWGFNSYILGKYGYMYFNK